MNGESVKWKLFRNLENERWVAVENLYCLRVVQGIPQQLANRQIACLILFSYGYFAFKKENVKVKVKYGFVLHTGFAGFPLLF